MLFRSVLLIKEYPQPSITLIFFAYTFRSIGICCSSSRFSDFAICVGRTGSYGSRDYVAAASRVPQTYVPFIYFAHRFSYNSPEFPQSWTLDDIKKDEGDGGSESEVENDDEPQHAAKTVAPSSLPQKQVSQAYIEFLRFLQLGCSGSPLQGYPTVMIILSTIPSSVRSLFLNTRCSLTSLHNTGYDSLHRCRRSIFASLRILHFFLGSR